MSENYFRLTAIGIVTLVSIVIFLLDYYADNEWVVWYLRMKGIT